MKNRLKRLAVLLLGTVMLFGSTLVVDATDTRSYTYNYDFWGDVQDSPDAYEVVKVYSSVDLGLDVEMKDPKGLYVNGDEIYVCDTGNNRIIRLKRSSKDRIEVKQIIDQFNATDVEVTTLNSPTDVVISQQGNIFIADSGNSRILKLDKDLNYLMEFNKPDSSVLDAEAGFVPSKIVVDKAERIYCVATGINKGLLKYENDGTFSGFIGATKVSYDFADYLWKKFATQEQRDKLVSFVPTEYTNLYMDYEGFIYAVCGNLQEEDVKAEKIDSIRKLNLMGSDILVRNGEWPVYGDLYMGNGGGCEGPSKFYDVTCLDNDIYICLDNNRGRLFGYDDQGRMVFAFGSVGNIEGYFMNAVALDHMDHDIFVLDNKHKSITLFSPTEFGSLVYQAIEQFDKGEYDASGDSWQKVMDLNGNYDLAYIGIGRSLLRQKRYHEAMKYFELKYDDDNYSKAFKQYRKEWVEENIVIILIILGALIVIPLAIGRIGDIKYEIDKADIFRN